jgi:hypothetical protein
MSAAAARSGDDVRQRLVRINERIAEAELNADVEALDGLLADDLLFRRANGRIVGKYRYLADLPMTKCRQVAAEVDEPHLTEGSAVVSVRVTASGMWPDGTEFSGVFGNARLFVPVDPRDGSAASGSTCRAVWLLRPWMIHDWRCRRTWCTRRPVVHEVLLLKEHPESDF